MRSLGCLVVALVVLGVALFFADRAVTETAERRTAHTVAQALDAETEVNFEGWPVAGRMLLGSIPTAQVNAVDVPLENGASLDRLVVELTDVEVNVNDLQGSNSEPRLPPAEEGTFEAELDEDSVSAMMGIPQGLAEVTLEDGVVKVGAGGLSIQANVGAEDGDVAVSLDGPLAALLGGSNFTIDLSNEPGQPYVEDVEIRDGVMIVSGRLEEVQR